MTKKDDNLIKRISSFYTRISFYYSDFLSLKEVKYNNNGLKENHYSRIRVVEKNSLGSFISNIKINDPEKYLKMAILNSKVASVLPNIKTRVYYPYIHTYKNKNDNLNYKNINKIKNKIKNYRNYNKLHAFNFEIKKTKKIIISNIGSIINQDFLTIMYNIKINDRNIFEHYKISHISEIKFPKINTQKIEKLYNKYNLILSPRAVAEIALYLFNENIEIKTLELNISPYLYKGIQSNLYDDEGTIRLKTRYNGLNGGNIFQKDNQCGYFYSFDKNKFIIKQPDLEIPNGSQKLKDITENFYLLVNYFNSIKIINKNIIINADLSLYNNNKNQGYIIKNIKIPLNELKDIKKLTKNTKVIGLKESSVKAPYIYIGKSYE